MRLHNERVRIICNKTFADEPVDIIRGIVTDESDAGLKVSGRHYQKIFDEEAGRLFERPVDEETKVIFIPFTSIKFCEIIVEDSRGEMIDRKVKRERPLSRTEIRKDGAI